MSENGKILPNIDPDSREFWAGTWSGQLLVQHCPACNRHQFYPRPLCTRCLSPVETVPASGRGTVYTFSVLYRAITPAWDGDVPYVVALIDLEEGVRMMANVVGCSPDSVSIGMPVEAAFAEAGPEVTLVQFRPSPHA